MTYKTIFSGHLEFGSERSYGKVLNMFQHRVEHYYRFDILLTEEDIFDSETLSLKVPRYINKETPNKSWKNTVNLLEYLAQFAVSGSVSAWKIGGAKPEYKLIEPKGDKVAVQAFLKGRELIKIKGKEAEAKKALSRAIDKFARHALAYERRGYINFRLRNYDDAMYDFTKSININQRNPESRLGRARVKILKGDLQGAIEDLGEAVKQSIPLQPIYWTARRLKSECHIELEEFDKAIFELKLFTKRQFKTDNPNYKWRKNAFFNYGKSLLEVGEYASAIQAFNEAVKIEEGKEHTPEADQFLYRGIALKKAGKKGFVKDWKEAAGLGSTKAAELLASSSKRRGRKKAVKS